MNVNLTAQDQTTIRTAAFGAVTLMSFAGISGSAHKVATDGTLSYASATGAVGHVLASKKNDFKLNAKSAAALADQVLPALTAAVHLLQEQDPEEAANFKTTVVTAIEASTRAHKGEPGPGMAAMAQKITEALDA